MPTIGRVWLAGPAVGLLLKYRARALGPLRSSAMFVSVQVTASLGRPIVQWSILEINEDSMTFADLFEAIKAGRFEVISMSEELKKAKLSKTFVGTKTDGLMATSSNQTLRVCSQFGNYIRFSVDLVEEDSVRLPATLPNAFAIMAASQRRLQLGDNGLPFPVVVKDVCIMI